MLDKSSGKRDYPVKPQPRHPNRKGHQMDETTVKPNGVVAVNGRRSPFFTEDHETVRDQVRRFVEQEIKPYGEAWEEQGFVPREVLRRMGSLGFFGIRYPEAYGGLRMDNLGNRVIPKEIGGWTFSRAAITAHVHTDIGSVSGVNARAEAQ